MNKKKLIIKISVKEICLELQTGKEFIDSAKWEDNNDMSTKLLAAIDTLLKKNKIEVTELADIKVLSDQQSYTSTRIAQAVAKTVGYCLT